MDTHTNNAGERKIFSTAIVFAILTILIFLWMRLEHPEPWQLRIALIAAAPTAGLTVLAFSIRLFTRSEAPAWLFTMLGFFVLIGVLMIAFTSCFRIPGFWVC
jgi:hypothetical protein